MKAAFDVNAMITKTDINGPLLALQVAENQKESRYLSEVQLKSQKEAVEKTLSALPSDSPDRAEVEASLHAINGLLAAHTAVIDHDSATADDRARELAEFIRRELAHRDDILAVIDGSPGSGELLELGYEVRELLPDG